MRESLGLVGIAILAACASTSGGEAEGETSIPYVRSNGISEWRAAGADLLLIKALSGQWYQVRTMGSCPRLASATTIGFEVRGLDQLDRHGAILVEGQRCPVQSVVRSEPPAGEAR